MGRCFFCLMLYTANLSYLPRKLAKAQEIFTMTGLNKQ